MEIRGGTGNNAPAKVSGENKLAVYGHAASLEEVCAYLGKAYGFRVTAEPVTGAGDNFVHIKNLSDTPLIVKRCSLWAASAEVVYFTVGSTGTANSPTAATVANKRPGSPNMGTQDATVQYGVDLQLTGGDEVARMNLTVAATDYEKDLNVVLQKNQTLVAWVVTGGINVNGSFVLLRPDEV